MYFLSIQTKVFWGSVSNKFDCDSFQFVLHPLQLVKAIVQYGGDKSRGTDLFGQDNPMARTRRFFKGLKVSEQNSDKVMYPSHIFMQYDFCNLGMHPQLQK